MHFIIITIAVVVLVYLSIKLYMRAPQFGSLPKGKYLDRVLSSPHFIKGRFRNKVRLQDEMSVTKLPTLIRQHRDRIVQKRPENPIAVPVDALYKHEQMNEEALMFAWFGHSALLLQMGGLRILIDPMLGNHASPVPGTVRRFSTLDIDWDRTGTFDLVLLSHDHYDHLDYNTIKKLKDKVGQFITPLAVGAHLRSWGIPSDKIIECEWNEDVTFKGLKLKSWPTKHFSGRTPASRNMSLWCAWSLESEHHKVLFSSDSGYWEGFKAIGQQEGPFDLCFVECGQYNHLWRENHMFPEESLQAFVDLKGQQMVPIHWAAFSLAPHDWREPVERLLQAAAERSVENIILPRPGQAIRFGHDFPKAKWWQ